VKIFELAVKTAEKQTKKQPKNVTVSIPIAMQAGCSVHAVYYILSFDHDYGTTRNPFA